MEKLSDKKIEILDENESLESYQRQLYNQFVNDKELFKEALDAGFTTEEILDNIGTFNELRKNREVERAIESYDDCVNSGHYYYFTVIKTNYGPERIYHANKFQEEHLIYTSHFIYKDFPQNMNKITISEIDNRDIAKKCVKKMKEKEWIYLQGAMRSGKSYLAIAILNSFVKSNLENPNAKVSFLDCPSRLNQIANIYFNDREDFSHIFNGLANCEILVLDNIGSEPKSVAVRDYLLIPLLNKRKENGKLTIFTSNHKIDRLGKMYELKNKDPNGIEAANNIIQILKLKAKEEVSLGDFPLY